MSPGAIETIAVIGLCALMAGLTTLGVLKMRDVGRDIDECFAGDCWNCPPERLAGDRETAGGEGDCAAACQNDVRTHRGEGV